MPTRPYEFYPTETFEAKVLWNVNTYFADQRYTVRAGPQWDELHKRVQEEWLPAGKVRLR